MDLSDLFTRLHITPPDNEIKEPCTGCREEFPPADLKTCPCGHKFCHECLWQLLRVSLDDESRFPPRCCSQQIPIEEITAVLGTDMMPLFHARQVEWTTTNRTYCSNRSCEAFVPPASIRGDVASCGLCGRMTCTGCKEAAHALGTPCPQDQMAQGLLNLALENNWQRCRACGIIVELTTGCHHITCTCRAQFCYLCGARWKTCLCPQFPGEEGFEDYGAAVEGLGGPPPLCVVHEFRRRRHCGVCDECDTVMYYFIYMCEICLEQRCGNCRRDLAGL